VHQKGAGLKQILFTILIIFGINAASAATEGIESDKQLHFGVCFGVSSMTYQTMDAYGYSDTQAAVASFSTAFAVGLGKEISDAQQANNKFDKNDIAFNALGALTATFLHWTF
jgi:uncharacterized protein YfiM (DUF2279 family)